MAILPDMWCCLVEVLICISWQSRCWMSFHVPCSWLYIFFKKITIHNFSWLLKSSFWGFFDVKLQGFPMHFGDQLLSDIWSANFFIYSVSWLFTLLIICCAKAFSLVQTCLSNFAFVTCAWMSHPRNHCVGCW
jgi:hypothetical protein